MDDIKMIFRSGYGGRSVKVEVSIGGKWYIVDNDEVERVFLEQLKKKGYIITKNNRQQYERVKIQ